jgi:general nucleoside transport system permease protein
MLNNKYSGIVIPLIAVFLGILAGAIIMIVSGYNPIIGYGALIEGIFGDVEYIGETIRTMAPLILAGLAVAFAFRTGLFNIGVEGQLMIGWLAAVWVGVSFELPKIIHLPLAIAAAGIAGAAWAFIPGFLKAKYKVHEVITTIMMNYVALYVIAYTIRNFLKGAMERTDDIHITASLASPFLYEITNTSRLHYGIIVALLGALVMWFLLWKTKLGYELRSVGYNQHAAQYAGMKVNTNIVLSMVISGAFAGIAGAMEGLGTFGYMSIMAHFTGLGFDGIAVALLGANSAIGVVLAAALFGGLNFGSSNMELVGVPPELVEIVIALIIFFVASSYLIRLILNRFKKEGK